MIISFQVPKTCYLLDRDSRQTVQLTVQLENFPIESGEFASMTPDGQRIASHGGGFIFTYKVETGETSIIHDNDAGDRAASQPMISANEEKVLFLSRSTNITPHKDTNIAPDLFIHDLSTGETDLVTVNTSGDGTGSEGALSYALSPDGRYVAFYSLAKDHVGEGVDGNGGLDLFLRDTQEKATTLVTSKADGTAADSSDPSALVFSAPTPSFSGDSNLLVFHSAAGNLNINVPDTNQTFDVFLYTIDTGVTTLVSTDQAGTKAANNLAMRPKISSDGKRVVYFSRATDVGIANDTNGRYDDVFAKDLNSGTIRLLSGTPDGQGTPPTGVNTLYFTMDRKASAVAFTTRDAIHPELKDENFQVDLFLSRQ